MITPDTAEIYKTQNDFLKLFGFSHNEPNSIKKWLPCDTEDLFDEHMSKKKTRNLLTAGNWTKDSIEYRFNNYGFRSDDDFDIDDPKPGNMFLGCSFTDGVGLNIEDVWSYKLNQKFGGAFYNLGQGGTGLDTQYRLFKAWAPVLKPKRAFTLGSFEPRREFISENALLRITDYNDEKHGAVFFRNYLIHEPEIIISYRRSWDAIKFIAIENNIELYVPTKDIESQACIEAKMNYLGRDLIHPGPAYHDYLVKNFDKWIRLV